MEALIYRPVFFSSICVEIYHTRWYSCLKQFVLLIIDVIPFYQSFSCLKKLWKLDQMWKHGVDSALHAEAARRGPYCSWYWDGKQQSPLHSLRPSRLCLQCSGVLQPSILLLVVSAEV